MTLGPLGITPRPASQIVLPTRLAASMVQRATATPKWRLALLVLALPMFAQCFQYMVDVLPLYALSKAWPVLMLPFFFWAMARLDVPWKVLQIVTLFWVLGVTPIVGILQLGNGFFPALATSVKVWAYSFVFSAAGLLFLLRPRPDELRRILIWLGIGTYVIMLLLWVLAPRSAYGGGDVATKLFMYDPERGYHLYMPMFFGMLLIFYLNRSFWMQRRVWKLVAIIVAFALQMTIYKERASIVGAMAAIVLATAWTSGRWRYVMLSVLAIIGGVGILLLYNRFANSPELHANFGGSLAVRQVTIATAWNFISADPLRWLIGNGATTRFGNITFAQIFGNSMFFLTDIGWLGVLFEYGLIGALLLLLVHLAGLWSAARWSRPDDPLSRAFADYIVYLLITSLIYSVVFTPGELTTIMALSYYFARTRGTPAGYGIVASQPARPMPRQIALASVRPSGRFRLPKPSGRASKG